MVVMLLITRGFTIPMTLLASNTINNHYTEKGRNSPLLLFFVSRIGVE